MGKCAVFVSSTRFAVLEKNRSISLKSLANETKRTFKLAPHQTVQHIFPGGVGRLLIRCADSVVLYDVHALKPGTVRRAVERCRAGRGGAVCVLFALASPSSACVSLHQVEDSRSFSPTYFWDGFVALTLAPLRGGAVGELAVHSRHPIKQVTWSPDGKLVAMCSKANIYVANARLEEVCAVNETGRVKSACWDPIGVLVYTTSTHIKYLLPNGDSGIIRSLDNPIYLASVSSSELTFLDRENKLGRVRINSTEYVFKLALMKHYSKGTG